MIFLTWLSVVRKYHQNEYQLFSKISCIHNNNHHSVNLQSQKIKSKKKSLYFKTNHSVLTKDNHNRQYFVIPLNQQRKYSKLNQLPLPINRSNFIKNKT